MGRRPGRAAAKQAAAALKNTPQYDDAEDETMLDAPTPDAPSVQEDGDEDDAENDEEEGTPAAESEAASAPTSPVAVEVPRKRKLGRPRKNPPPDRDSQDRDGERSETGTPAKRGRGRGGFGRGGGRWARRGGPSHVTQQPVDKEGNMMDVIDDEVELPEDSEGEKKVDKLGYLQGGREYRCRTFTVTGRGERLYMLSTEPARCVGFRDSYLFFTKHKRLFKIIINEEEKHDLIDRELIPHSYKGRAIGIVTARSVFREFGAQIIVGGKRIFDDYEEAKLKAEGVMEGEIADPKDIVKVGEPYNQNQYVAWHGASSVYHSGAPTVPMQATKAADPKRRKVPITDENWQYEHAKACSEFNSRMAAFRRANNKGVYNIHTNQMHYPKSMQPTQAKWERIDDEAVAAEMSQLSTEEKEALAKKTIFTPVNPAVSRNFLVVDTQFETAPYSHLGVPGPDGDLSFNGLAAVSDEMKDLLPPECRQAFDEALEKELDWKSKWKDQNEGGQRGKLKIFTAQTV